MILRRNRILYVFLITSFYISLFLPIIEGLFRHLGESYLMYIKALTQGYIFLLPLFIILLTDLHTKRFYLIILLFFYTTLSQIFAEYASLISVLQGCKSFFAVLLYIPIVYHLVCHDVLFQEKIEKHIKIVFIVSVIILYFEIFSRYIHNDLYQWFISLAYYESLGIAYSRPIGIGLDIHMQGIILSSAIFYYFIHKKYLLSLLFFFALFLSGIKTWLIGVLFLGLVYFLISCRYLKITSILKFLFTLFCTIVIIVYFFEAQIEHYIDRLSPSSDVASYMAKLWLNAFDFFINSIIPTGFLTDEDRLAYIPQEIIFYNDIPVLFLGYMIGSFGLILYMVIIYYNILQRSTYTPIVILSLCSLIHAYYLNNIGIFIMITYFGMYYIIENYKKTLTHTSTRQDYCNEKVK